MIETGRYVKILFINLLSTDEMTTFAETTNKTECNMKAIHALLGGFCSLFNIVGQYNVDLPKSDEEALRKDYDSIMRDFGKSFFIFEQGYGGAK